MGSSRASTRLLPSGHGEVKPRACCDVATPAVIAGIQNTRIAGR